MTFPSAPPTDRWKDTTRLSDQDRMDIICRLEGETGKFVEEEVQWFPFATPKPFHACLWHPGGSVSACRVYGRLISNMGLTFLHGSFVHTGSTCKILLQSIEGQPCILEATVINCRHVTGLIHEVAVAFADPIDPGVFIAAMLRESTKPMAGAVS